MSQDLLHFLMLQFFQLDTLMQDTCQMKIATVEIKSKTVMLCFFFFLTTPFPLFHFPKHGDAIF
jgi:hypothetical protein